MSSCIACGDQTSRLPYPETRVALANDFREPLDTRPYVSHKLSLCCCDRCSLVQIPFEQQAPPADMFVDYPWSAGISEGAKRAAADFTRRWVSKGDTVLEIACNDGTLLRAMDEAGANVIGVDPASPADAAVRDGYEVYREFWCNDTAKQIVRYQSHFDLIVMRNVIGHCESPRELLSACVRFLRPDSRLVIESPWVGTMLAELQVDQVFHEHTAYWSVTALMQNVYRITGMWPRSVDTSPHNGGSFVVEFAYSPDVGASNTIQSIEKTLGVADPARWSRWWADVELSLDMTQMELLKYPRVAAVGAAAKFSQWLQLFEHHGEFTATDIIEAVYDESPDKAGKLTPGTCIPVHDFASADLDQYDALLIGAWNHAEELREKIDAKGYNGRLLTAVPRPRYL